MQQSDFELKNSYQLIPIGIAGIMAIVVGCVTHFFKIDIPNTGRNMSSLLTAAATLLLYGYDLGWMRGKIFELEDAASMADVRINAGDRKLATINLLAIACYILLSVLL